MNTNDHELKRTERMGSIEKIVFKEESFKIIGACMKVNSALSAGFLESVYPVE